MICCDHEYAPFLSENFIFNQKFWATSDLIKTWWGKSVLVTNLWSKLFKYTISRMFVGFQILQQPGHIILCFRSICIQTVAFWLYFTFIQQFGASYPILPSPNMWNTKNWAESNSMLFFCDKFWLMQGKLCMWRYFVRKEISPVGVSKTGRRRNKPPGFLGVDFWIWQV